MQHWYVYYTVPSELRDDIVAEVRRLQESLVQACGVRGRLVERGKKDTTTLMEIYEHVDVASDFGASLDDALARSALPAELRAARRTELFQDIG
jgi:hypothetical protein